MKVYFCLRHDHDILPESLKSIEAQTIKPEIIKVNGREVTGNTGKSERRYTPLRVIAETSTRQDVLFLGSVCGDEFFCMSDRDVIHLKETNLFEMEQKLVENKNLAAVALSCDRYWGTGNESDDYIQHINIGFCMFRAQMINQIILEPPKPGSCLCVEVVKQTRKKGKFIYLDEVHRYIEEKE